MLLGTTTGDDLIGKALGCIPSKVAEMYEGRNAIKGREGRLVARREEIANMFVSAAYSDESGQRFRAKLDTHSEANWTVGA